MLNNLSVPSLFLFIYFSILSLSLSKARNFAIKGKKLFKHLSISCVFNIRIIIITIIIGKNMSEMSRFGFENNFNNILFKIAVYYHVY